MAKRSKATVVREDDRLLVNAGLALARLDRPMNKDEVRDFAVRAIDVAAMLRGYNRHLAMTGRLKLELGDRRATDADIELIGRAVLNAFDSARTLTKARSLLRSMWIGALLLNARREEG